MQGGIGAVVRAHWKRFAWIWAFPLLFFASIFVPASARYPTLFLYAVDFPVFLLCGYLATKPVRDRQVTFGQGFLLILLVPFLIWIALIFGLFGLGALLASLTK
jgi:hypothetical protein